MYTLEALCAHIGLAPEATQAVLSRDISHVPLEKLRCDGDWDAALEEVKAALGADPDGFGMLACHLRCALAAWEDFEKLGLSHQVYVDTMGCFSRFVNEHKVSFGHYGFDRGFWTVRQISCKLFRFGELEYEPALEDGKRIVSIHIPSDANLECPLLRASYLQAKAWIGPNFPDFAEAPWGCGSWLLSPDLQELLPAHSRILAFQKNFRVEQTYCEDDFKEWVYKRTDIPNRDLPEDTSLQRNLKAWLLSGRIFRSGVGELIPDPFL